MQLSSKEHFGLIESTFASTFGGLLDIKTEDLESGDINLCTNLLNEITNDDHTETILQSTRSEIINELDIDPQLLSLPQPPSSKPAKHKADDSKESQAHEGPPHKLLRQIPAEVPVPESSDVAASLSNKGVSSSILDHYLKPRSQLPYCKALSHRPTATSASTQRQFPAVTPNTTPLDSVTVISPATINSTAAFTPILRPPGMTRSQHFFSIATRIDARAMQISGDIEFHCSWR
ncbi:hypothetical protein F4604DRAFT_1688361 [Suillus subluteus]|nr:hypothetical protein F4604DRAFT_1688361 [Suillus subluteus]